MKHGFIKVATATPIVSLADCEGNLREHIRLFQEAERAGVKLLVFPELSLTGYTCGDLFFSEVLLSAAKDALSKFLRTTKYSFTISIIGLPLLVNDKLYNCAVICQKGQILGIIPKTAVPHHKEFSEARYFCACEGDTVEIHLCNQAAPFGTKQIFVCENIPLFRFGVEICEDLWVSNPPSNSLTQAGALIIANLSASNETVGKDDYRRLLVQSQSARTVSGYLFANCGAGESTTDLVFGGHSLIAENGVILSESLPFSHSPLTITELDLAYLSHERRSVTSYSQPPTNGFRINTFSAELEETYLTRPVNAHPFIPQSDCNRRFESILSIQAKGLAQRILCAYAKKCILGISGGLDSTLAVLVAVRAMDLLGRPHSDVIGVTMPCFGTTNRTKSNAELLCEELGTDFRTVPISASVRQHFLDIGQDESKHDVVYENAQARERTQVIMDLANMEGGIVVGTGDLSELALGWATYNGDHMSMYGVNANVPKTLIRHLVSYCAESAEKNGKSRLAAVLRDIVDTPVSPELLPADDGGNISQITEDLVGPYELHDFYLYRMLRCGDAPDKMFRLAKLAFVGQYSDEILLKWLKNFVRRFFAQQFKRSCLPDGPKVGSVGLSPRGDWKMPSDASAKEWMRIAESLS